MKVLVTGGSGFIGSVVVRRLLAAGHEVRCLLRATSRTERIDGLGVERVIGDVRDPASLRAAADACAATVHLAGLSSWNEIASPLLEEVVVRGTANVLEAAAAAGHRRLVYVSSAAAVNGSERPQVFDETAEFTLDDPALTYSRAKRRAEALCREQAARGLHVAIVNPAEVYGPGDSGLVTAGNLLEFARGAPVLVPEGGTGVVHVEDVAAGILAALERGRAGQRYILGGENLTVRAIAELTLSLLGRSARVLDVPNALLRAAARAGAALRLPLPFNPHLVPYATRYWFVDAGKARRELGVTFRSARETLEPTVGWLRSAGYLE